MFFPVLRPRLKVKGQKKGEIARQKFFKKRGRPVAGTADV